MATEGSRELCWGPVGQCSQAPEKWRICVWVSVPSGACPQGQRECASAGGVGVGPPQEGREGSQQALPPDKRRGGGTQPPSPVQRQSRAAPTCKLVQPHTPQRKSTALFWGAEGSAGETQRDEGATYSQTKPEPQALIFTPLPSKPESHILFVGSAGGSAGGQTQPLNH